MISQLNELVKDKLVTRHSYNESPPKVEYELTDKARELIPIFNDLYKWRMYLMEDENKVSQFNRFKYTNYQFPLSINPLVEP